MDIVDWISGINLRIGGGIVMVNMDEKLKTSRILVVEDDPDMIGLMREALEDEGYTTYGATNGTEGLKAIREIRPDLVLLDLMMPGMSGLDVCHELEKDEELKSTPIIVVSVRNETAIKIKCIMSCANRYVTKPFDVDHLKKEVWMTLRQKRLSEMVYDHYDKKGQRGDPGAFPEELKDALDDSVS